MAALYATQPKPTTLPTHELLGGFKPDESVEHQVQSISQNWLSSFEVASKTNDAAAFAELFAEDSFWRESALSAFATRRALTSLSFRLLAAQVTLSPSPTTTVLFVDPTLLRQPR